MKNKILKTLLIFCSGFSAIQAYAQDGGAAKKLVYTIQVDGLVNRDQVKRLDNSFKEKTGILSDEINFETKTIVIKTVKDITYSNVCDILSVEKLKAQNYVVKEE